MKCCRSLEIVQKSIHFFYLVKLSGKVWSSPISKICNSNHCISFVNPMYFVQYLWALGLANTKFILLIPLATNTIISFNSVNTNLRFGITCMVSILALIFWRTGFEIPWRFGSWKKSTLFYHTQFYVNTVFPTDFWPLNFSNWFYNCFIR